MKTEAIKMSGYKYCVKFRFSSEFYTQPDWVVVGYFRTLEGAEQELEWQRKTGSKNLQVEIFEM